MSDTIVVGTDGSETAKQAVAEAVRLAKALDAEVHVVTAFEPARRAKIVGAPEGAQKFWGPLTNDVARSTIDDAAARIRAAGVRVEPHMVQQKDPADALLEVAREVGGTLIVVGSQGMAGARRLLGSVPNKISHEAHCNVLIVATTKGAAAKGAA
jgi:nucleotide-binding universal stress UspA family protein